MVLLLFCPGRGECVERTLPEKVDTKLKVHVNFQVGGRRSCWTLALLTTADSRVTASLVRMPSRCRPGALLTFFHGALLLMRRMSLPRTSKSAKMAIDIVTPARNPKAKLITTSPVVSSPVGALGSSRLLYCEQHGSQDFAGDAGNDRYLRRTVDLLLVLDINDGVVRVVESTEALVVLHRQDDAVYRDIAWLNLLTITNSPTALSYRCDTVRWQHTPTRLSSRAGLPTRSLCASREASSASRPATC